VPQRGEAGVTGRSTTGAPSELGRNETIEGTAQRVDAAGGRGIAVRCDHARIEDVDALRARLESDGGRLDVLVNDIWGGEKLFEWNKPVWAHDLENGLRLEAEAFAVTFSTDDRTEGMAAFLGKRPAKFIGK
jgi:NAD(P)-dependent dehydrogenase (short-subunit alcohol dehydrogenase family)